MKLSAFFVSAAYAGSKYNANLEFMLATYLDSSGQQLMQVDFLAQSLLTYGCHCQVTHIQY